MFIFDIQRFGGMGGTNGEQVTGQMFFPNGLPTAFIPPPAPLSEPQWYSTYQPQAQQQPQQAQQPSLSQFFPWYLANWQNNSQGIR